MEPDVRDAVVDFVRDWAEKAGLAIDQLLEWLELSVGNFLPVAATIRSDQPA